MTNALQVCSNLVLGKYFHAPIYIGYFSNVYTIVVILFSCLGILFLFAAHKQQISEKVCEISDLKIQLDQAQAALSRQVRLCTVCSFIRFKQHF